MFVLLFCTEFCGKQPQKACLPALSRAEYFLYFYTSIDCFALNFFLKRLLLFFSYNAISFPPLFPWILTKGRHLNSHISIYLFKASFCTISWLSSFNVTLCGNCWWHLNGGNGETLFFIDIISRTVFHSVGALNTGVVFWLSFTRFTLHSKDV